MNIRCAGEAIRTQVCTQAIEEEVKKSGVSGEVCPVRCDLRRESDIMDMFQLIRSKYGRIDVCLNNAGLVWENTLTEGTTEEWREMLDVSVFQPQQDLTNSRQHIFIRHICIYSLKLKPIEIKTIYQLFIHIVSTGIEFHSYSVFSA